MAFNLVLCTSAVTLGTSSESVLEVNTLLVPLILSRIFTVGLRKELASSCSPQSRMRRVSMLNSRSIFEPTPELERVFINCI